MEINFREKYHVAKDGSVFELKNGQWRSKKISIGSKGYPVAWFSTPRVYIRIHRVVAELYVPNPRKLPVVNHLDCDKTNNRADNLEWTDNSGNWYHASENGLIKQRQVPVIGVGPNGEGIFFRSQREANLHGFFQTAINAVLKGRNQVKTTGGYTWYRF